MRCFVRHGQTDYNLDNRWMGSTDLPLNAIGIAQSERIADYLAQYPFEIVFSSPLKRAMQTADIILQKQSVAKFQVLSGLAERSFGELEGRVKTSLLRERLDNFSDVESEQEVIDRVIPALSIMKQYNSFLIVSHSNLFKLIVKYQLVILPNKVNKLDNADYTFFL